MSNFSYTLDGNNQENFKYSTKKQKLLRKWLIAVNSYSCILQGCQLSFKKSYNIMNNEYLYNRFYDYTYTLC